MWGLGVTGQDRDRDRNKEGGDKGERIARMEEATRFLAERLRGTEDAVKEVAHAITKISESEQEVKRLRHDISKVEGHIQALEKEFDQRARESSKMDAALKDEIRTMVHKNEARWWVIATLAAVAAMIGGYIVPLLVGKVI